MKPLALAILLGLSWCAASAADPMLAQASPDPRVFDRLALELLSGPGPSDIGPSSASRLGRIAIQPLRPEDADLPPEDIARFDDQLERALRRLDPRTVIVPRRDLASVWREIEAFTPARFSDVIARAGVDTLVVGQVHLAQGGVELAYKAYDIRLKDAISAIAFTGQHLLPWDTAKSGVLPLEGALLRAANGLAQRLGELRIPGDAAFHDAGERAPFTDYLLPRLMDQLRERLAALARRGDGPQPVTGQASQGQPTAPHHLGLAATAWDHGDFAEARFAVTSEGRELAGHSVKIDKRSVPAHFLPLTQGGGVVLSGVFEARGFASAGTMLSAEAAERGALALARARIIASATGGAWPRIDVVREPTDAARLLDALTRGVTYDEQVVDRGRGDNVQVRLRARVKRVGEVGTPAIDAELRPNIVRNHAPIALTLTARRDSYAAVFAWSADGTVIRVWPRGRTPSLRLAGGRSLALPAPGEPPVTSEPLPGSAADEEALIVIASSAPLDFSRLAPDAGTSAGQTTARAVPTAEFLNALARLDVGTIRVVVLPYQVMR